MKDHYSTLGVSPDVPPEVLRERYRRLVISCHPDKFLDAGQKARAEEMIKELNEAYGVLSDPAQRAAYDRQRAKESRRKQTSSRSRDRTPAPRWVSPVMPIEDLVAPPPAAWGMTDHLHYVFLANRGDIVEVRLNRGANVILLDGLNYARYRAGGGFRYLGGYVQGSPAALLVPYPGAWNLVVDTGGYPGSLQATARLIRRGGW